VILLELQLLSPPGGRESLIWAIRRFGHKQGIDSYVKGFGKRAAHPQPQGSYPSWFNVRDEKIFLTKKG